jgi:N-acetylglutamate synthase-like GNAT family acetyltransferase
VVGGDKKMSIKQRGQMCKFKVRLSDAGDLAQVDELLARAYPILLKPDYPASILVTAISRMARANPSLLASGSYYVAETRNGSIVGCGGWGLTNPNAPRRRQRLAHVRHFATDPNLTRQGVARAIMARCLADVADYDVRWMECHSTRTAVPFYCAMGFEEVREMLVPLAPGVEFPAILMVRDV